MYLLDSKDKVHVNYGNAVPQSHVGGVYWVSHAIGVLHVTKVSMLVRHVMVITLPLFFQPDMMLLHILTLGISTS